MDDVIDLDLAALEIEQRSVAWRRSGISVGDLTWRDQSGDWPPTLKTDRSDDADRDSVGVQLHKGQQEGEVVLFKGGWCDLAYWSGDSEDDPIQDAPGYPNNMTIKSFGEVLDRLAAMFR